MSDCTTSQFTDDKQIIFSPQLSNLIESESKDETAEIDTINASSIKKRKHEATYDERENCSLQETLKYNNKPIFIPDCIADNLELKSLLEFKEFLHSKAESAWHSPYLEAIATCHIKLLIRSLKMERLAKLRDEYDKQNDRKFAQIMNSIDHMVSQKENLEEEANNIKILKEEIQVSKNAFEKKMQTLKDD